VLDKPGSEFRVAGGCQAGKQAVVVKASGSLERHQLGVIMGTALLGSWSLFSLPGDRRKRVGRSGWHFTVFMMQ
jgi:hypothetical protein